MHDSFENLNDDINYSTRFIIDRQFELIDKLHAWANEIIIKIVFILLMRRISKIRVFPLLVYIYCHR